MRQYYSSCLRTFILRLGKICQYHIFVEKTYKKSYIYIYMYFIILIFHVCFQLGAIHHTLKLCLYFKYYIMQYETILLSLFNNFCITSREKLSILQICIKNKSIIYIKSKYNHIFIYHIHISYYIHSYIIYRCISSYYTNLSCMFQLGHNTLYLKLALYAITLPKV